jgi:extracellular elastinolytic metalloproteinase
MNRAAVLTSRRYQSSVAATEDGGFTTLAVTDWVRDFVPSEGPSHGHKGKSPSPSPKKPSSPHTPVPGSVAEYRVYEWGTNDPTAGKRHTVVAPADTVASPHGWHTIPADKAWRGRSREDDWMERPGWSSKLGGGFNSTDTRGNNVFAQENWSGGTQFELNHRPVAADLNFSFPLHWGSKENRTGRAIDPKSYIDVAVTELFYTCNEMHVRRTSWC